LALCEDLQGNFRCKHWCILHFGLACRSLNGEGQSPWGGGRAMIGGRSDQIVLLRFATGGRPGLTHHGNGHRPRPARRGGSLHCSHWQARAPPHELSIQDSSGGRPVRDPGRDTTLGQRLGPASPAGNQAPCETTTAYRSQGMIQSTSAESRCKRPTGRFSWGMIPIPIPIPSAAPELRESEVDP
jgi:hypothetical protein